MSLFATRQEPTPEETAEGWEIFDPRPGLGTCDTYAWIGQDFSFCDRCSRPCWEHPFTPGFGDKCGLRRPQSDEDAEAMWRKWGEPRGLPFTAPSIVRHWRGVGA